MSEEEDDFRSFEDLPHNYRVICVPVLESRGRDDASNMELANNPTVPVIPAAENHLYIGGGLGVEKFNGTNYEYWRHVLLGALEIRGCTDIVTNVPPEFANRDAAWKKIDGIARH